MNLFELFVKLNNRKKEKGWIETTARFTGRYEKAVTRTKTSWQGQDYNSYEIVYTVDGKERHGWYSFYPVPDPSPDEIADMYVHIRYKERKPFVFEMMDEEDY